MGIKDILRSKVARNASWLMVGRVIQMVLSLVVGLMVARYLGPDSYGLLNYAGGYVTFFASLCNLGINSILVKEFIDHPDLQGETIGTTLVLRAFSSALSVAVIFGVSLFVDSEEPITIAVVFLCSLSVLFQIFETFNYWFQSRLESRATAVATLFAYLVTILYRVVLLVLHAGVVWFALASVFDYGVLAVLLVCFYRRHGGAALSCSFRRGKALLAKSYHFILPSLMVSVYGFCDKFMLKQMMDSGEVGCYAAAQVICNMWCFVLSALIDSLYPSIMEAHKEGDEAAYLRLNRRLYCMVFYVSIVVSLAISVFSAPIVGVLYGEGYAGAVVPLSIITWYTAFSYLGVARNAWVVSEEKQSYLKWMYIVSAVLNVLLNLWLIPAFGATGAAAASLATEVATIFVIPSFFREIRPNVRLMFEAITFKNFREKERAQ